MQSSETKIHSSPCAQPQTYFRPSPADGHDTSRVR
jgi:hypothetical protein